METELLDYLANRLDIFISDLRLGFTQPALSLLLEVENCLFPVEEWNRALTYLTGKAMRLFLCHRSEEICPIADKEVVIDGKRKTA